MMGILIRILILLIFMIAKRNNVDLEQITNIQLNILFELNLAGIYTDAGYTVRPR